MIPVVGWVCLAAGLACVAAAGWWRVRQWKRECRALLVDATVEMLRNGGDVARRVFQQSGNDWDVVRWGDMGREVAEALLLWRDAEAAKGDASGATLRMFAIANYLNVDQHVVTLVNERSARRASPCFVAGRGVIP